MNTVCLVALIAVAVLLLWLSTRALRIRNRLPRWSGFGLTAILALVFLLASGLTAIGLFKLHGRDAPVPDIQIVASPAMLQRGQELANTFCAGCHATDPDPTLVGGVNVGKHLPLPLGTFISANLTPAGELSHWSDGQIFRAIRNGVDADGDWLVIMSYTNAGRLSDYDTTAVIAYLRTLPAAGEATPNPPDRMNLLGVVMLGAGMMPTGKPVNTGVVAAAPPKGPTQQYGEYILSFQDCRECHGKDLSGGVQGQMPPIGPGLSLVKDWSPEQFIATMRTGVDPTGHALAKVMPWRPIGKMDDVELHAIYEYLTHLPI